MGEFERGQEMCVKLIPLVYSRKSERSLLTASLALILSTACE
jgi:hypothetical protein